MEKEIRLKMNIQFFGGRGAPSASSIAPNGSSIIGAGSKWSGAPNVQEPDTLKEAIGDKGRPMSMQKAVEGVNPYYSTDYREFSENCQRSVVAYELRRRGYDVEAQPTFNGDVKGEVLVAPDGSKSGRWQGAFQGAKSKNISGNTGAELQTNVSRQMQQYGDGSRAIVGVQWKNGGGHVFNVERHGGVTYYIDPQVNRRYSARNVFDNVKPNSVRLVRVDNKKISSRAKDMVEPKGTRR